MGTRPHSPRDYLGTLGDLDVRFVAALVMAPRGALPRTRSLNDGILSLARETRGRFFPLCSVHPGDGPSARKEIHRVAREGAKGLKLHPNTQAFDVADPQVRAVVREAAGLGLPVLFDAYSPFDADQPGKFVRLAMEVPEARLVLAHAHGPKFAELLVYDILARYPWWKRNVWVDLSATASLLSGGPLADGFGWVLRKVGADRLLFGSDYPLDDPLAAVRAVTSLGFSPGELRKIFYENAVALFGLEPLAVRAAAKGAMKPPGR